MEYHVIPEWRLEQALSMHSINTLYSNATDKCWQFGVGNVNSIVGPNPDFYLVSPSIFCTSLPFTVKL